MTQYTLTKYSAVDFDPRYWGWTIDEFVNPKTWEFTADDEDNYEDGEIGVVFALVNCNDYDQGLPFDFGGNSDQPWEATVTVPKENKEEFVIFLESFGFNHVKPWW